MHAIKCLKLRSYVLIYLLIKLIMLIYLYLKFSVLVYQNVSFVINELVTFSSS